MSDKQDEWGMNKNHLAIKIGGVLIALVILFPANTYISNKTDSAATDARQAKAQSQEICLDTNKNRKIGNSRAEALREFLQIAADGRHDSYTANVHKNLIQAQIDKDLENKYKKLKTRVKLTKLLDCTKGE